jgi:DHA1 family multidrug resistance protein-like MFS transporter
VGPLLGSVAGVAHLRAVFLATAAASVAATVPVRRGAPAQVRESDGPMAPLTVTAALTGVLLLGVAGGAVVGVYETCWSLLLTSRHASAWQIGLSWTLFAAPFAAFSPVAGRLTDRFDRRWLAAAAMVMTAAFASAYPFIPDVAALVGLGALEAVGVAIAMPATQSLLAHTAVPEALGRAQGLFGTAETAAMAVAAGTSGYLFSVARWAPFIAAATLAATLSLTVPFLCRRLPGRASPIADDDVVVAVAGDSTLSAATPVRR